MGDLVVGVWLVFAIGGMFALIAVFRRLGWSSVANWRPQCRSAWTPAERRLFRRSYWREMPLASAVLLVYVAGCVFALAWVGRLLRWAGWME